MSFRRFIPYLAAMMSIMIMFACGCAIAENLLENADLVHIGSDGLPADWYTDAYILEKGYSEFSVSEGDPEHPLALFIQNYGENDARFVQTVEVEPDTLYCLSGYVRAENIKGGHGANLSIEGIYAFSDEYYDTDGEWEYIEYYGETGPEQDTVNIFARLGGYSGVSTGKAWFAGVSLTKAERVPGDGIADLWYRTETYPEDPDEELTEEEPAQRAGTRKWLFVISAVYTVLTLYCIYRRRTRPRPSAAFSERNGAAVTFVILCAALAVRIIISWLVEGYMVDVNCFLSWGHTMASAGPVRFYEATNFCDYPPLYTYILAINSAVSGLLGGSAGISRIVFRLIPSLCDLAGAWILSSIMLRRDDFSERDRLIFTGFAAFNPAAILNSAAWGQMDSVLCMLLVCVVLYAVRNKWKTALPLYVIAVLIKPQALMLGPLGLVYIIITWIRKPECRRAILIGTCFSFLALAAGVIPFSLQQNWDWLIQLYIRTLGSYPYATVNTANLYYLLGGNWSSVTKGAHFLAPAVLGLLTAVYGIYWYLHAGTQRGRLAETIISFIFAAGFALIACNGSSWAWTGGLAMAFAFVIVISQAVRSGDIKLLPWLGGLLFILLYVFGVKMHERYIFPAFLLLAYAWILKKDRRILYVIILFTSTVFINEGIVLDNSIRLGSQQGHLLSDTEWIADLISILNVIGSIYAVWLGLKLFHSPEERVGEKTVPFSPPEWKCDRKLYWNRKDSVLLLTVTMLYTIVCMLTLGSTKAPQTGWCSSSADEQIIFDLGEYREDVEILYFAQVSRKDFSFSASSDGVNWDVESWAQMDQGQCWKWKYATDSYEGADGNRTYYNSDSSNIISFSGRYIRLTSQQVGLKLNELLFRNEDGDVLPVMISGWNHANADSELYSDPEKLIDEQDSMEGLPSLIPPEDTGKEKIQPSWWNSTYFDEIYHARTAYEFLNSTVPYETSHPPLGKILMSICVAVFGMTPFGWRFAGALAGILMLPGMYLLGKQLTKKTWAALLACMLMALDCMHLTQTQIATIDSFPVLFIIFAYFFMLRFTQTDFIREKRSVSLISLALSGLFMGLSIASKWIGIYAGAGLAVLFFRHCIRTVMVRRKTSVWYNRENIPCANQDRLHDTNLQDDVPNAVKKTLVLCAWCVLFFIVVPVMLYLVSYIPYFAYNSAHIHSLSDYISEVWRAQIGMFNYHSTPNLGMDHPFYSPWWQWPVIGKPMYYASQQYLPAEYPVHHSIFAFGNPVIWYWGLGAILICFIREIIRRRYRSAENDLMWHLRSSTYDSNCIFILIGLLAQYLPWVLVPRGTYIYHYFASLPFLMLAVCLGFSFSGERKERIGKIVAAVYVVIAAIFFIILFPYASGMNVSAEWLELGKHFLRIWY